MIVYCGVKQDCAYLCRAKVFGCPTYVLDPKLQNGKKIPKWKPRACLGQFLGFSEEHSTTVSLVRNIRTDNISAQFHVVHDQRFETVPSDHNGNPSVLLDDDTFRLYIKDKLNTMDHDNSLEE